MVGWHEFEQTLGDTEGQRSLVCCSPWGHRVRYDLADMTQQQLTYGGQKWAMWKITALVLTRKFQTD